MKTYVLWSSGIYLTKLITSQPHILIGKTSVHTLQAFWEEFAKKVFSQGLWNENWDYFLRMAETTPHLSKGLCVKGKQRGGCCSNTHPNTKPKTHPNT